MARSARVLTARGGPARHAAVVARGWGIPAVTGASEVVIDTEGVTVVGHRLRQGELVNVDGATGGVFLGVLPGHDKPVPQAGVLRSWREPATVPPSAPIDSADEPPEPNRPGELLVPLLIKGLADGAALTSAIDAPRGAIDAASTGFPAGVSSRRSPAWGR